MSEHGIKTASSLGLGPAREPLGTSGPVPRLVAPRPPKGILRVVDIRPDLPPVVVVEVAARRPPLLRERERPVDEKRDAVEVLAPRHRVAAQRWRGRVRRRPPEGGLSDLADLGI